MYLGFFGQDTQRKHYREINNIDAISNTMMTMLLASCLSLKNNRATNIDMKIVILDPSWCGLVDARHELPGKAECKEKLLLSRSGITKIARDHPISAVIHTQGIFNQAMKIKGPLYWTDDSVHPSHAGHMLIAKEVINVLEKLV